MEAPRDLRLAVLIDADNISYANIKSMMEEIAKYLGVDSLGYLDVEGMVRATGKPINEFCLACFTGDYPLPVDPAFDKFIMEKREARAKALADQEAQPTLFADLK